MGGMAAALEDAEGDWLLVMPVDLPLLPASALRTLVDAAVESGEPTVTCFDGVDHRQPLPVVLHSSVAPVLAEALERGERRLMPVLRRAAGMLSPLGMRLVPVASSMWLTNVNTPEELRMAEEMAMVSNDLTRRASE
jgi:molybdopterin-guanine dinucleotide biosynthesis protein A